MLAGATDLTDFGAGSGELITQLARRFPEIQMTGIDLSPGFVENFNSSNKLPNVRMEAGLIDAPMLDAVVAVVAKNSAAISVLTLDRVQNPKC